jgi:hypothetical protein
MFLAEYHFDGAAAVLLPRYHALLENFPVENLQLHICVATADGLTVFDACPDRATFEQFSTSAEFAAALTAVGLPAPRSVPVGEVHNVLSRNGVAA